jgi:hypothetical protein
LLVESDRGAALTRRPLFHLALASLLALGSCVGGQTGEESDDSCSGDVPPESVWRPELSDVMVSPEAWEVPSSLPLTLVVGQFDASLITISGEPLFSAPSAVTVDNDTCCSSCYELTLSAVGDITNLGLVFADPEGQGVLSAQGELELHISQRQDSRERSGTLTIHYQTTGSPDEIQALVYEL